MPPRPGRRNWTRAEDYLPPRRNRRAGGSNPLMAPPAPIGGEQKTAHRPLLGLIPFLMVMFGLGILAIAIAIAIAAWPGRMAWRAEQPPPKIAEATFTLDAPKVR